MVIMIDDSHIVSIKQIEEFLKVDSLNSIKFKSISKKEQYQWIDVVLNKFSYLRLKKKEKGKIKKYIIRLTGLSSSQLGKIIQRKKKFGRVFLKSTRRHTFPKKYYPQDIALLVKTDNLHHRLSGRATKEILSREYYIFNQKEYQNISRISASHIYNLRETRQYRSQSITIKKTKPKSGSNWRKEKTTT